MASVSTSCLELAEHEQYHPVKAEARSEPPIEGKHLLTVCGVAQGHEDEWTIWACFLENLRLDEYENWLQRSLGRGGKDKHGG